MLVRTLQHTLHSEITLLLLHYSPSPFVCMGHVIAVHCFSGILYDVHIICINVWISSCNFLSPYLVSSALLLFPDDFLFFDVLIFSHTLSFVGGFSFPFRSLIYHFFPYLHIILTIESFIEMLFPSFYYK